MDLLTRWDPDRSTVYERIMGHENNRLMQQSARSSNMCR